MSISSGLELRPSKRRLALLGALACLGCAGAVVPYEGGVLVPPRLQGDEVERDIDRIFRERTGVWLGMPSLVAEEQIRSHTGASYGRVPPSGGVSSFVLEEGSFLYLYRVLGPPGSGEDTVCGIRIRWRAEPPPTSLHAEVGEVMGDRRYKGSDRRVVAMTERSITWVDPEACPERVPQPEP